MCRQFAATYVQRLLYVHPFDLQLNCTQCIFTGLMVIRMKLKMIVTLVMTLLLSVAMAGCNTLEGVGKDIKKAGESIEGAAK